MDRKGAVSLRVIAGLLGLVLVAVFLWISLGGPRDDGREPVPGQPGRLKSTAKVRSTRRAYDGAPPTVPHQDFGASCIICHTGTGIEVQGIGFAPPLPHAGTPGLSAFSNCRQCHVFRSTEQVFVASIFEGYPQDLRKGDRMYPGAPPRLPHGLFMREDCSACHGGPAAREEVRCRHPERKLCLQCHVPVLDPRSSPFE